MSSPLVPRNANLAPRAALLGLTALLVAALQLLRLPAAFLLGAMGAAMIVVGRGATLRLPEPAFALAQAVVGCLVARNFTPALFHTVFARAGLFAGATLSVLLVATAMGLALARTRQSPYIPSATSQRTGQTHTSELCAPRC